MGISLDCLVGAIWQSTLDEKSSRTRQWEQLYRDRQADRQAGHSSLVDFGGKHHIIIVITGGKVLMFSRFLSSF